MTAVRRPGQVPDRLVEVIWDDLAMMALSDEVDLIVQDVTGWYDTPAVTTNDVLKAMTDGALYGPKVFGQREITISGTAMGERAAIIAFRDALATRVANNLPTELIITDPWLDQRLSATVRASADYKHTFKGPSAFTYQLTLSAADPRRYALEWQQATLTAIAEGVTGREYPRTYPWRYAEGVLGDTALLTNNGDVPAPVYAVYDGPLVAPRLTDGHNAIILSGLADGVQILVNTQTLVAQAPGGASRSNWVMPGSVPMTIPPRSSVLWRLDATGAGMVTLNWRATYI